jgi:protein-disulfide isomerase
LRKYGIAALIIVVVAVTGVGIYEYQGRQKAVPAAADPSATAATNAATAPMPLYDDDHVLGSKEAPITMIEYASLTCPHCAHFHNDILPQIKTAYIDTGKVKLVFRSYPLDQAALKAAELAECVSPVTYFPMVSLLFKEQGDWAHGDKPVDALAKIAAGAGIDQAKFQSCLDDKAISDRIIARAQEGQDKFGIQSTPTFFVNGRKIEGAVPYEDFEKVFKELQP